MSRTRLERTMLIALGFIVALFLLGVPFGNVHFSRWTLELESEPHPLWIVGLAIVGLGLFITFGLLSRNLRVALANGSPEVRSALQPAVWADLSIAAFGLTQALFVMATSSSEFFESARIPLALLVALSLLSLGIWTTVLTRRLKNEHLKDEWDRLLKSATAENR